MTSDNSKISHSFNPFVQIVSYATVTETVAQTVTEIVVGIVVGVVVVAMRSSLAVAQEERDSSE